MNNLNETRFFEKKRDEALKDFNDTIKLERSDEIVSEKFKILMDLQKNLWSLEDKANAYRKEMIKNSEIICNEN